MASLAEKLKNKSNFDVSSYHPLIGADMEANMAYAKLLAFAIMADEKISQDEKNRYAGIIQLLNLPVEDCLDYLVNLDLEDFEPLCHAVSSSETAKRVFFLDACYITEIGSAEKELFEMIRKNIGIKKETWEDILKSGRTISSSTKIEEFLLNPARYNIEEYLHILQKRALVDSFVKKISSFAKAAEDFCTCGINGMDGSYNEIYDMYLNDDRYEDKHHHCPWERSDRHARQCDRALLFCRGYGNPLKECEMTYSWSRDRRCSYDSFDSWEGIRRNYGGTYNLFEFQNKISPLINGLWGLEPEYVWMEYTECDGSYISSDEKYIAGLLDGNRKRLTCWKYSLLLMCGSAKRLLLGQAKNLFDAVQKEASEEKYDAHYEAFKDRLAPMVRTALHGSLSNGKVFSEGRSAIILSAQSCVASSVRGALVDKNGKSLNLEHQDIKTDDEETIQTGENNELDFLSWLKK